MASLAQAVVVRSDPRTLWPVTLHSAVTSAPLPSEPTARAASDGAERTLSEPLTLRSHAGTQSTGAAYSETKTSAPSCTQRRMTSQNASASQAGAPAYGVVPAYGGSQ